MKLLYKNPYAEDCSDSDEENVVECSKCEKEIKLEAGFYHCIVEDCEEDYHRECLPPNNTVDKIPKKW